MNYRDVYEQWMNNPFFDEATKAELRGLEGNETEIQDRFYKDLEFGTAGLRGIIGAGTNRMNAYIVARATQGLAEVIKSEGQAFMDRGVAIAYDCRHFSHVFSKTAALVLAGNGIKAYLFEDLRPTPELSFAVRHLNCGAGIVVTASHNPQEYNGYKAYWEDGAQILPEIADVVTEEILKITDFESIPMADETEALASGLLVMIGKEIDDIYINKVKALSLRDAELDKSLKIVYTPLNGAGNVPVRRILAERGFADVTVVPEQEMPDPDFTTVGYPNPEDTKAFAYAERLGKEIGADLLIATDPDCDRLAVEVINKEGGYTALNGNQTGAILVQYLLESYTELGTMPENPAIVKSIVTGDLAKVIAEGYGVKTFEALTGFKNICSWASIWEESKEQTFVFGYEESIGFLAGDFVRDKDAVNAAMFLAEAAAYYRTKGKTLLDILEDIFVKHGTYRERQVALVLEGIEGAARINRMMTSYRANYPSVVGGIKLLAATDYAVQKRTIAQTGKIESVEIPPTNGLKFEMEGDSWYALRPSGTEPKIKLYLYSRAENAAEAEAKLDQLAEGVLTELHAVE
ncbi:phospho-sugar mutase [Gottschalkiaceae bacterium SANA]|nr:phospho-sugar mutase [Gottschalkiaceae bacterium SANA]